MPKNAKTHPWSGTANLRRAPTPAPLPRTPRTPETVEAILRAVATASYAEVAVAYDLTRGAVAGLVDRARKVGDVVQVVHRPARGRKVPESKPRPRPVLKVVAKPALVRDESGPVPMPGLTIAPVPPFGTGVGLLDTTRGQCRALDDVGECCCRPVWRGTSWCDTHHAAYVRGARRLCA